MNLNKSYDYFAPDKVSERIHIIGCGAIGSTVAENLCRFGLTKITLYDFDHVTSHNIANQMFRDKDIGKLKTEAMSEILSEINPDIKNDLEIDNDGYIGQKISGYVCLCLDNIDTRREIATKLKLNSYIKAMFDWRIGLTSAQHYAADWKDTKSIKNFINSMQFTHEEAKLETPTSACNLALSVCPTVRNISALGVANMINFMKGQPIKQFIFMDSFKFWLDT